MRRFLDNIIDSLKNDKTGFSLRKITAVAILGATLYSHLKYVNAGNVVEVLVIDFVFISLLLGLVTAEQVIKFKQDGQNDEA